MSRLLCSLFCGACSLAVANANAQAPDFGDKAVLVIHGGAGGEPRDKMTAERDKAYRQAMEQALQAGYKILSRPDGSSLDAVEAAIKVLEDSPLYNAGRGAVFNRDGRNELNSSIMDGKTRKAGAVAGISRIKNPISAARAVMEKSPHVFLIGDGAERFARDQGLEMVSPLYFWTERSWQELQEAEKKAKAKRTSSRETEGTVHFGTVGAVALDAAGNLAAGTSTGGITYVMPGRIGDSPIIGAGTYAENRVCAVSCTGVGELFIRHAVSHDISARVKYKGDRVALATKAVLDELPGRPGGVGGIIALDAQGTFTTVYNTEAMHRAAITRDGHSFVAIYEK